MIDFKRISLPMALLMRMKKNILYFLLLSVIIILLSGCKKNTNIEKNLIENDLSGTTWIADGTQIVASTQDYDKVTPYYLIFLDTEHFEVLMGDYMENGTYQINEDGSFYLMSNTGMHVICNNKTDTLECNFYASKFKKIEP